MSEHPREERSSRLEGALHALYQAATPAEPFVAELEQRLLSRSTAHAAPRTEGQARPLRLRTQWPRLRSGHRWATAVACALLALAIGLAGVGPGRVLAGIQELVGYVPGIGFLDLQATRLLAAPVEVTRDGVTLRVEQVIAAAGRTEVVVRSLGLPAEDQLWPDGARGDPGYEPVLRLPDGRALTTGRWKVRLGAGNLEFEPLPEGVYHVTLELARLPLVPAGAAPEGWFIPLTLRPATGELVSELFPQPYLVTAEDTRHEITLRVLEVAHTPAETAVRLQAWWTEQDGQFPSVGHFRLPELRDNLGHVYHEATTPGTGSSVQTEVIRIPEGQDSTMTPTPEGPTQEWTLAFAPISPSAGQLTLWVDAVDLEVPAEASFMVDLGDDPQVGDRWPLNVHLTVAGFPVHISGAQLIAEELALREGLVRRTWLQFDVGPVPEQNGRTLYGIVLVANTEGFGGSSSGYDPQTGAIRAGLELRDGARMPVGPIEIQVERASVAFHGPWTVTWTLPGAVQADQARVVPIARHPENAVQTRRNLTLRVSQAVQTDRLTAVTVELDDPQPGVTLNRVMPWTPATDARSVYLADDGGRRYGLSVDVFWQADRQVPAPSLGPAGSRTLSFEPVQLLARRVILHVPRVELFVQGSLRFEVVVPEGVELSPRSDRPGPVSEPWEIDVPLEVGGYRLRLPQAQLEAINDTMMLRLNPAAEKDESLAPQLTGLRPISIVAPDGHPFDVQRVLRFDAAGMWWDVADPETGAVQPGRYQVELEGVTIAVAGPWKLTWNVR
jgi:hypothetical protein